MRFVFSDHLLDTGRRELRRDSQLLARAALAQLRRAQPDISLAWIARNIPIKHDADREHYLEGFRRAGLD
jgi:hypothetical protein